MIYKKCVICHEEKPVSQYAIRNKKWIEYNFDKNMTWNNQGTYWDIDHVTPCDFYDLTLEKNIKYCFNWRNLRPLSKPDNNVKLNKYDSGYILNTVFKKY